jgi:cytochrome c oxidase cbb3-type subunit 1
MIGIPALLTFHNRREPALYVSQWFLLAALFWFPWIYSTANLLLVFFPVRGVLQAVVDWWYIGNLTSIWFAFIGLAAIFYFLPKLAGRPLHSNPLAILAFWTLALFGGWGGIHSGAPVPAWMPSISTVFTVLGIVPLLAIAINFKKTFAGASAKMKDSIPLRFIAFGAAAYLVAEVLAIVTAFPKVSLMTHFTLFTPARTQLFLYGFLGMTMFGAIYYVVPLAMQKDWPSAKLAGWHFKFTASGLSVYAVSLALGGLLQGLGLGDPAVPFATALHRGLILFRMSTLGDLLMAAGNVALAVNLGWLLVRCCRECCVPAVKSALKPQWAEVAR